MISGSSATTRSSWVKAQADVSPLFATLSTLTGLCRQAASFASSPACHPPRAVSDVPKATIFTGGRFSASLLPVVETTTRQAKNRTSAHAGRLSVGTARQSRKHIMKRPYRGGSCPSPASMAQGKLCLQPEGKACLRWRQYAAAARRSRRSLLTKDVLHLVRQRFRQIGDDGPVANLDEDFGRHTGIELDRLQLREAFGLRLDAQRIVADPGPLILDDIRRNRGDFGPYVGRRALIKGAEPHIDGLADMELVDIPGGNLRLDGQIVVFGNDEHQRLARLNDAVHRVNGKFVHPAAQRSGDIETAELIERGFTALLIFGYLRLDIGQFFRNLRTTIFIQLDRLAIDFDRLALGLRLCGDFLAAIALKLGACTLESVQALKCHQSLLVERIDALQFLFDQAEGIIGGVDLNDQTLDLFAQLILARRQLALHSDERRLAAVKQFLFAVEKILCGISGRRRVGCGSAGCHQIADVFFDLERIGADPFSLETGTTRIKLRQRAFDDRELRSRRRSIEPYQHLSSRHMVIFGDQEFRHDATGRVLDLLDVAVDDDHAFADDGTGKLGRRRPTADSAHQRDGQCADYGDVTVEGPFRFIGNFVHVVLPAYSAAFPSTTTLS
ncbi:hypothetical protein RHECNPAF_430085 [Rhizobium etli CNPAF512]|nr:hypothetical protein RHECNPAF_430085 [Rhizobium etli CNPAF512]